MILTLWEIWSYAHLPLIWYLFKRFARRDVSGSMIAGSIVGCFLEFSTEPLWTYHFRFTFYKDIAPSIVLGWGVLFTLTMALSEAMYRRFLRLHEMRPDDKRLFFFDVVAAVLVAFPMETMGLKSGVWDYNYAILNWSWGVVPFFEMPLEALFGYMLLMTIAPTFILRWREPFNIGHWFEADSPTAKRAIVVRPPKPERVRKEPLRRAA